MSGVDEKNNELCMAKRELLGQLESTVIEHTNLIRDLREAEEKVRSLKSEVERAQCRRTVARTRYEQAEMEFTSYREKRAKNEESDRKVWEKDS